MADGDVTIASGTLAVGITLSYNLERDLGGSTSLGISVSPSQSLTNGTGDNQADLIYRDATSVGVGGTDIDLAGGLTDDFGQTLTFVEIVAVYIKNTTASGGGNLLIGGAAANQWVGMLAVANDVVKLPPGGVYFYTAPYDGDCAVVAGTGDILQVAASAGTATYDIILVGRSA